MDYYGNAVLNDLTQEEQARYESVFCIIWGMVVLYMIIHPITNNALLIRMIWVPSMLLLSFISVPRIVDRSFLFNVSVPVIIIAYSFISQSGALDPEHALSAFCYVNLFFVVYRCKGIAPGKKAFDFIYACSIALTILFTIYTRTPIAHRVYINGITRTSLYYVFNLGNSNIAAMYIFAYYCILLINLAYRKRRAVILFLMACDLYLIYGTRCRSVMLSVVIVTIAFFLLGRKKLPGAVVNFGTLIPVFFAIIYMWLYRRMGDQTIVVLEKSLFSGRQNNYTQYLSYLDGWEKVLFGNFSEAGFQNAHNICIGVLASSGIVGLIAFYFFYIRLINELNDNMVSSVRTISIICILGLFVQSSMEASFFLGGFPGIMIISTFVMMSNYTDYDPWSERYRKAASN